MLPLLQEAPKKPTFGQRVSQGLANAGASFGQGYGQLLAGQQAQKQSKAQKQSTANMLRQHGINVTGDEDPEILKAITTQLLKNEGKMQQKEADATFYKQLFGGNQGQQQDQSQWEPALSLGNELPNAVLGMDQQQQQGGQRPQGQQGFNPVDVTPDQMAQIAIRNPDLANAIQKSQDSIKKENRENRQFEQDVFEHEREYHRKGSEDYEKQIHSLRDATETQEYALALARSSIENNNPGMFSADNLARVTNQPYWNTVSGAQFGIAVKTNLAGNISKATAKAQNKWYEQVMSKAFAQVGSTQESNLAAQEAIEGEVLLNTAKIKAFDAVTEQQEKKYTYGRKGRDKEVARMTKEKNKEIVNRSAYRTQELFELEQGLQTGDVGKNVPKGKPLTFKMMQLYKAKFGDKAEAHAKKNGYHIPSAEEYKLYKMSPSEYAETINF